jgi:cytoskeletal protein CcmA (bactofilin family)
MPILGPIALTTVTAGFLLVPVLPALQELRRRADATPLGTSRHDGRITNFADAFRARLEPLRHQLEECRISGEIKRVPIESMRVLLVGRTGFDFGHDSLKDIDAVFCAHSAHVPEERVVDADVYVEGSFRLGRRAAVRAAISTGDAVLEAESTILRWLHSDGNVFFGRESSAFGRASARRSMFLEPGCSFEHVHAPKVIGISCDSSAQVTIPPDIEPHTCHSTSDRGLSAEFSSSQRQRIYGDFELGEGETLYADIVARGGLRLQKASRLVGSIKCYKDGVIGEQACIHGSVVSEAAVRLSPHSFVAGPILAEGDVRLMEESCVGAPGVLTTISCRRVHIAPGCQLHGTVWAREGGIVES